MKHNLSRTADGVSFSGFSLLVVVRPSYGRIWPLKMAANMAANNTHTHAHKKSNRHCRRRHIRHTNERGTPIQVPLGAAFKSEQLHE